MITKYKIIAFLVLVSLVVISGFWIRTLYSQISVVKVKAKTYEVSFNQCEKDKITANEVSNDYQEKLTALDIQLLELRGLHHSTCTPVDKPSSRHNAAPECAQYVRENGVRSEWLIDFAGEGEKYRLQLMACQDFILRISEDGHE